MSDGILSLVPLLSPKVNKDTPAECTPKQDRGHSASKLIKSQTMVLSTHTTVEVPTSGPCTRCSNSQALMNLLKGTAGTGILSLPTAFKNVGLWAGLALFLIVGMLTVHCMLMLNSCCHLLEKRSSKSILTYVDAVELNFQYGPKSLQKSAAIMKTITSVSISIMQCSFCCVYIVWVAVNVKEILDNYWSNSQSLRVYEVAVFLILLPYIMVKSLNTLAFFSTVANLAYLIGLIIIFQSLFQGLPDSSERPAFSSWSTLPLFFGTSMFAFESICLTISVRSKLININDYGGWNGLLSLAMTIIIALYSCMGFYGYLKFGEDTATTITLNLPQNNWLYTSVTILFVVAMILSVGIQFYVPISIIWPAVKKQMTSDQIEKFGRVAQCFTRAVLLTLIFAVSVLVPHLDSLMVFIGSFFGSVLSLILPALMELMTLSVEGQLTVTTTIKDAAIIIFGMLILIFGTVESLKNIITTF
ncbi:proton-coupled amino acid transporter 2-like isoform X1 [Biomphalaria glabrata]|uniref:Proton-coupled amino acid transporter 2-like isoform X1 n=1 Tax=Biomphalaria glabrata TaxID=6526 RepID=A0A9W3B5J1_BIOGL|nr:proton-coupled amino acid transporter 2-like isoform X1 [Biomphalaria glabrata]